MLGQLLAGLAVAERAVALLGHPPPRAQVDLVDRQPLLEGLASPRGHPALVAPAVVVTVGPPGADVEVLTAATTEAVAGGTSAARASGSARSTSRPAASTSSNL